MAGKMTGKPAANQRLLELDAIRRSLRSVQTGNTHVKHLLRALYDEAALKENNWVLYVDRQTLAAALEVSVKTVDRSIAAAAEGGFLKIVNKQGWELCLVLQPLSLRNSALSISTPQHRPGALATGEAVAGRETSRPGAFATGRNQLPRAPATDSPPAGTVSPAAGGTGTNSPHSGTNGPRPRTHSPDGETNSLTDGTRGPGSETNSPQGGLGRTNSPHSRTNSPVHQNTNGVFGVYINTNTKEPLVADRESPGLTVQRGWKITLGTLADPADVQQLFELALERGWVWEVHRHQFFVLAHNVRRRALQPKASEEPIQSAGAVFTRLVKRREWLGAIEDEEWANQAIAAVKRESWETEAAREPGETVPRVSDGDLEAAYGARLDALHPDELAGLVARLPDHMRPLAERYGPRNRLVRSQLLRTLGELTD